MANQSNVVAGCMAVPCVIVIELPPVASTQQAVGEVLTHTQPQITLLKCVLTSCETVAPYQATVVPWSKSVLLSSKKTRLSLMRPNSRTIIHPFLSRVADGEPVKRRVQRNHIMLYGYSVSTSRRNPGCRRRSPNVHPAKDDTAKVRTNVLIANSAQAQRCAMVNDNLAILEEDAFVAYSP